MCVKARKLSFKTKCLLNSFNKSDETIYIIYKSRESQQNSSTKKSVIFINKNKITLRQIVPYNNKNKNPNWVDQNKQQISWKEDQD